MKQSDYKKIILPLITSAGKKAKKNWHEFKRANSKLKSKKEIVTKTDKEIEKLLRNKISKYFPSHDFLGEELGRSGNNSDYLWIIDPIDGTTNFSIHNPLWCISLALSYKEEIIFGVIYAPALAELFYAIKGKGAWLNNKKLTTQPIKDKKKLIHAYCHGSRDKDVKIALEYYKQQKLNALDCRQLGSAAIEIAYVAAGRIDSILIPGAHLWDVAGGVIIAQESQASVINFKGKKWSLDDENIIACHQSIEKDLVKRIGKIKNTK